MKFLLLLVIAVVIFWGMIPATYYRKPQPESVIHATPDAVIPAPDEQPVPAFATLAPSLPITSSSFATDPNLAAFSVRYISAEGTIEEHCLKKVMADSIPSENVMGSSLDDGQFRNLCPAQETLDYKPWPF